MPAISLPSDKTLVELEARHLWKLSREVTNIKRTHVRTGEGVVELRDELDLLATRTNCRLIAIQALGVIARIDKLWPFAKVA